MLCQAKEAAAAYGLQKLQAPHRERGWGLYREKEDLASFDRSCECAASFCSSFQGGTEFLKQKAKNRRGEVCRREEGGLRKRGKRILSLKSGFRKALVQPFDFCSTLCFNFFFNFNFFKDFTYLFKRESVRAEGRAEKSERERLSSIHPTEH